MLQVTCWQLPRLSSSHLFWLWIQSQITLRNLMIAMFCSNSLVYIASVTCRSVWYILLAALALVCLAQKCLCSLRTGMMILETIY